MLLNRRKAIYSWIAALMVPTIGNANLVKSMLAGFSMDIIEEGMPLPTTVDYISDGLIAMYDGIENVGLGTHDESATIWVDLIGSNDGVLTGTTQWQSNCLYLNGSGYVALPEYNETGWDKIGVVEFVCSAEVQNRFFFDLFQTDQTGWCLGSYSKWYETYVKRVAMLRQVLNGTVNVSRSAIHYNGADVTVNPNDNMSRAVHNRIGCRGNSSNIMFGKIYAVRIYSRLLTEDEMAYNNAIDKIRFNL